MSLHTTLVKKNISEEDIHLWIIHPQQISTKQDIELLRSLLSESEKQKVDSYQRASAQHNALVTRALLRRILSSYTGIPPQQLLFNYTEHGKPTLANTSIPIHFNISHNNERLICAVSLNNDIGCDIESTKRKVNVHDIAKRYFSNDEFTDIESLVQQSQKKRFFEYWTLKEAFVKCTGRGLSQGLDSFSFEIGEASSELYNCDIHLRFMDEVEKKEDTDYDSILLYPDDEHCIAVCINKKNCVTEGRADINLFSAYGELINTIHC